MADGHAEVQEQIRAFVVDRFPGAYNIGNGDSLLDSGVVDSIGVLELVTFIEDQFAVSVTDDDLLADHFESIASLTALVCAKRGGEEQPAA